MSEYEVSSKVSRMNERYSVIGVVTGMVLFLLIQSVCAEISPVDLIEIRTDDELSRYLGNISQDEKGGYFTGVDTMVSDVAIPFSPGLALGEMKSSAPAGSWESAASPSRADNGIAASRYTTTNIQVAGVDEADFVKNDGKYIYIVNGNDLSIVQVYPPATAAVVSRVIVPGSPTDLFLSGDRLVLFTNRNDYLNPDPDLAYRTVYGSGTTAILYDITDHTHPRIIREITAPGMYQNARMIGNDVYLLSAESGYYFDPRMPVILDGDEAMKVTSVWCPPQGRDLRLNTLTSFPVRGGDSPDAVSFLVGWDSTLYVSLTDLFVAYQNNRYGWSGTVVPEDPFRAGVPVMPAQESVIHRFSINGGEIRYKATGSVPGYLLNQFSLDQYDGNLRVATTLQDSSIPEGQFSNVYVLNPDLEILGRLERLAPGEKIYSARFMGDILYLVTFRQTDPLFVIDLSLPEDPVVLGKLKIPGYSDYLHPLDRTHLIGIGKDTYENSGGGVIPTGVKVALFDVSDLNDPKLTDSLVIGEKGSDSAVLTDHRAFLFDKERNIMVLPIKEVIHSPVTGSRYDGSYSMKVWQGAYVFGVNPSGFTELGRVTHGSDENEASWWSESTVRRSLFMDSVLYTISQHTIIGSELGDLSQAAMRIRLSSSPESPWYMKPLLSVLEE